MDQMIRNIAVKQDGDAAHCNQLVAVSDTVVTARHGVTMPVQTTDVQQSHCACFSWV
jgi:hypothetical protein